MPILRSLSLLCLLSLPLQALAHPHAWIDLHTRVQFDDQGRITALEQTWDLDIMYSLVVLEQIHSEAEGDDLQQKLRNFSRLMIRQVSAYDYMTRLQHADRPLQAGAVQDYSLEQLDGRLRLQFVLPLLEPVDPLNGSFSYSVYDPTFYIEISHDQGSVRLEGATADCSYAVRQPQPTDAMRERAVLIDVEGTLDEDLGRHFAERTEIRCTPGG